MKVLFIRPNQIGARSIPIGMTVLQAYIKKFDHEARIFDTTFLSENVKKVSKRDESLGFFKPTNIDDFVKVKECNIEEELLKNISEFKPDLIAFSLMSNDLELTIRLAKIIKKSYNNIPIILGGIHPTVDPESSIKLDCIDMICIGEGEKAFLELLNKMEKNDDITRINNIWVKKHDKIFRNDVRPFFDMDDLPPPDCSGFSQMHLYRPFWGKVYRIIDVEIIRGCLFSCSECINAYLKKLYRNKCKYHREKSLKKAISDLKYIKKKYKPEMLRFVDEILFPWDIEKLKKFAKIYKKEIGLPFIGFGRIEYLTKERVKILKEMGCVSLSIGIESGNEELRKKILNRYMSNKQIIKAFQICNRNRLRTTAFNLIALPEEGRKEIFDTIEVNRRANPGLMSVAFVYPFLGTPLRDYCLKKGYIKEDDPIVDYNRDTIIKNDKISKKEQIGLCKTFVLYILVPKWMYPIIRFCESDNLISNWVYRMLIRYYRDINFKKNNLKFDEIPDTRELSILKKPPVENF